MVQFIPHLWFQASLKEVLALYQRAFPETQLLYENTLDGTPSGTVSMAGLILANLELRFLASPAPFQLNPSFSLLVACQGTTEVDHLTQLLGEDGQVLMPLGSYPFSPRYSWVVDRFGLSWQVMDFSGRETSQRLIPTLMYTSQAAGHCEEAIRHYVHLAGSSISHVDRYGLLAEPNRPMDIRHLGFQLGDMVMAAMDSSAPHDFTFSEAASLIVEVDSQKELDYWWDNLSSDPEAERCGWLKDAYGVSWQIVPRRLGQLMGSPDEEARSRVRDAFLAMKKFNIAELEKAALG